MKSYVLLFICLYITYMEALAGDDPKVLIAYRGTTPVLDGYISTDEYTDAELLKGVKGWFMDTKTTAGDSLDLSIKMWYKHDGSYLYFAFDVLDDVLFGHDIEKWAPSYRPNANEMSYKDGGWPFFADGFELFMNPANDFYNRSLAVGDGSSWQIIVSTLKSTLGGFGTPGLIEALPFNDYAWDNYRNWFEQEFMKAVVRLKPKEEGRGYVVELRISPNPCLQINDDNYLDLNTESKVGMNIEFQDLDEKEKGDPDFYHFRHVAYLSKAEGYKKSRFKSFATLLISPEFKDTCNRK